MGSYIQYQKDDEEQEKDEEKTEISKEEAIESFQEIDGIGPTSAERLFEGGYRTLEELEQASVDELTDVEGIGPEIADTIKEELKE